MSDNNKKKTQQRDFPYHTDRLPTNCGLTCPLFDLDTCTRRCELKHKRPVAVLNCVVIPTDGTYAVVTVPFGSVDITGVPHYIGHQATHRIVERMGAVKAPGALFGGLKPGERAVCFPLRKEITPRRRLGRTPPYQRVTPDDLACRVLLRLS